MLIPCAVLEKASRIDFSINLDDTSFNGGRWVEGVGNGGRGGGDDEYVTALDKQFNGILYPLRDPHSHACNFSIKSASLCL